MHAKKSQNPYLYRKENDDVGGAIGEEPQEFEASILRERVRAGGGDGIDLPWPMSEKEGQREKAFVFFGKTERDN